MELGHDIAAGRVVWPLEFQKERQGNRFKTSDQTDGRSVGWTNERTAKPITLRKRKKNDTTTNRRYGTQSVPSGTCCCLSLPPLLQTQTRYERTCRLKDVCPWPFHFDYFRLPVADASTTAVLAPQHHPVPTRTLLLARSGTKMTPPRKWWRQSRKNE